MSENRGSVGNLDPTARVAPPRKQAGGGGQSAATETTPVGDVELGLRSGATWHADCHSNGWHHGCSRSFRLAGTDEPEEQPQHTEQDRGSGSTDEHEHENKDKEFIQQELRRRADFSQSRISSQESVVLQATGFLVVFLGVLLSATAQSTGDLHCGNKWTVVTLATVVAFFYLAFVLVTYGDLRKQYAWQEGYRERSTRDKPPTIKEAKSEVEDVSFPTVFLKNDGKQLRPSFQPGPDNPYLYGSLIFLILPTIVVVLVIVSMVHILCDKQPGSPSPAPSSGKAFVPW